MEGLAFKTGASKNLDAKIVLGKVAKSCQTSEKKGHFSQIIGDLPRRRPNGGAVLEGGIRRRDADGGGRDDRAPGVVAHGWGGVGC